MRFEYRKLPSERDAGWVSQPEIPVRLTYRDQFVEVYALIDSGADVSVFHASLGVALGIDVQSGREHEFFGIPSQGVTGYFHEIEIEAPGLGPITVEVAFIDSPGVAAILGQTGFFDHHKIVFERYKNQIEITAADQTE